MMLPQVQSGEPDVWVPPRATCRTSFLEQMHRNAAVAVNIIMHCVVLNFLTALASGDNKTWQSVAELQYAFSLAEPVVLFFLGYYVSAGLGLMCQEYLRTREIL